MILLDTGEVYAVEAFHISIALLLSYTKDSFAAYFLLRCILLSCIRLFKMLRTII